VVLHKSQQEDFETIQFLQKTFLGTIGCFYFIKKLPSEASGGSSNFKNNGVEKL